MTPTTATCIQSALDEIYRGQTNVAVKAKEVDLSLTELKELFNQYVLNHPICSSDWENDIELSWPWV
jgi:hypothetical protein